MREPVRRRQLAEPAEPASAAAAAARDEATWQAWLVDGLLAAGATADGSAKARA